MNVNSNLSVSFAMDGIQKQVDQTSENNQNLEQISPITAQNLMDSSFEKYLGDDYAYYIKQASLQYLKSTIISEYEESKGFDDENLFHNSYSPENAQLKINQIIKLNEVFTQQEIKVFKDSLNSNFELITLIESLIKMFPLNIFHELCFVIHKIWQIYSQIKQQSQLSQQFKQLAAPKILMISSAEQTQNIKWPAKFRDLQIQKILQKSQQKTKPLFQSLLKNPNIRYINLRQINSCIKINNNEEVAGQFVKFMEEISRSVMQCAEGYFKLENQNCKLVVRKKASFQEFEKGQNLKNLGHRFN